MTGFFLLTAQEMQVKSVAAQIEQALTAESTPQTDALADKLKTWLGPELKNGIYPKIDQTTVIWAIQGGPAPTVVSDDGTFRLPLSRLGKSDLFVAVSHLRSGRGFHYQYLSSQQKLTTGFLEVYEDEPDMYPQAGIPKGVLTKMNPWTSSIFPQTKRDWWIYTPNNLRPTDRPALMVFQDGQSMKDYVPNCLDNLIAKRSIPPMIAIFIEPGTRTNGDSDRSFEYDTLSDQYAKFVLDEILPEAAKHVPITANPEQRAICGMSSGGICAFTVAWQRPNEFRKVLSMIGSFTDIAHGPDLKQGGHNYPSLIRLTTKKPLRIFLQDGINDLDNQYGSWPLANQSMARALAFKGYDYTFTLGEGNHSDRQTRAILPDMLKWLWR